VELIHDMRHSMLYRLRERRLLVELDLNQRMPPLIHLLGDPLIHV